MCKTIRSTKENCFVLLCQKAILVRHGRTVWKNYSTDHVKAGLCLAGKGVWIFPVYSYRYNSIQWYRFILCMNISDNMEF